MVGVRIDNREAKLSGRVVDPLNFDTVILIQ